MGKTKPFVIPKDQVLRAFQLVKANSGSGGVDKQSLEDFERNLRNNLYKIWNRMSSGTYFPPAVKAVEIPKKSGGTRTLGIPTVSDRVAQMVVKLELEPQIEPHFLDDSYGYRPKKSALEAVGVTRQRCFKYDWVLEFDIRSLFDEIRHDLLMKAVEQHTSNPWVLLYVRRWLTAPMQKSDGTLLPRQRGTPQGGVVSPLLANLFMHYAFDVWISRAYPHLPWCRYADDGLVHCNSEVEARQVRDKLTDRLDECGLELHPKKTKIVQCVDWRRPKRSKHMSFDFLGFSFRPREGRNKRTKKSYTAFGPGISKDAQKTIRATTRRLRRRTDLSLEEVARLYNPRLRGWINYYGRYRPSELYHVLRHFNQALVAWAQSKYKSLRRSPIRAGLFLQRISETDPKLFYHWSIGMTGQFV